MSLLDIDGAQIAQLSDEDLRALVVRLCEAELRRRKLDLAALTAGGNQNSSDGGLDVRVALSSGAISGFIPRLQTGFQVKAQDMPRQAILDEMRPGGALRPVIEDLASTGGAYVMVSSRGSV